MRVKIFLILFIQLVTFKLYGQLDQSFNGTGKLLLGGEKSTTISQMKTQSDGKYLLVGYNNVDSIVLVRLTSNGSLDPTLNSSGIAQFKSPATLNETGRCLSLLNNNQIIIGVRYRLINEVQNSIIRVNSDGQYDNSFGTSGLSTFTSTEDEYFPIRVSTLPNDKVLVLTNYDVFRLTPDGAIDNTFGTSGILEFNLSNSYFYDMSVQSDGKILVAGESGGNSVIIRVNANGTFDPAFGTNGIVTVDVNEEPFDRAVSIITLLNGNILVGGYFQNTIYLMQLSAVDGSLIDTYGSEGVVTYSYPGAGNSICNAIAEDPTTNDILVAGTALYGSKGNFALSRVSSTGVVEAYAAIDMSDASAEAKSLVIQPDRKIVLAGTAINNNTYNIALARLMPDFETIIQSVENIETITTNINLFPNPSSQAVNIHSTFTIEHITVLDIVGNEVMNKPLNGNTKLDISALPKGLYNLVIKTDRGVGYKKLSVQ